MYYPPHQSLFGRVSCPLRRYFQEDDLFENNRIKGALEPTRGFGDFKLKLNNTSESNDKSGNKETNNDSSDEHEHKWTPPYITAAPEVFLLSFSSFP